MILNRQFKEQSSNPVAWIITDYIYNLLLEI
jgi:hypothetical protein